MQRFYFIKKNSFGVKLSFNETKAIIACFGKDETLHLRKFFNELLLHLLYKSRGNNRNREMATVKFTFEDKDIAPKTVENVETGHSILEVTEDNDIHLNHNCGEVCACSTCHIYVTAGDEHLQEISDKEEDFIDRAINPRIESRLGCQSIILNDDAVIEVEIPDQKNIIGHEH